MYDRILVPTDGSEGTAGAVEHAIHLAGDHDAELHVVSVVPTALGPDGEIERVVEALEGRSDEAVAAVRERAEGAGVDVVRTAVVHGDPHREILDYVDEEDVDLVVMGTHGRTGLERYLLGSVTEKVVRLADVPVLTVPLPGEA